jgi:peptidoglycan/xylan/chitin deacetylase (PgdA/CDA1 family)
MSSRRLPSLLRGRVPVVYSARGRPASVALTFDDGPSRWTGQVAAALEEHGCRGTFFLRGAAVAERPDALAALHGAGHDLGNHLWSHTNPETQSRSELRDEIGRTNFAVNQATGAAPILVRPPYCAAPDAVSRAAFRTGTRYVVLRSVDPEDWKAESADHIVDRVLAKVGPGDIVCLHDGMPPRTRGSQTRDATVAAVERLVPALLERGLRPVPVTELLR